MITRHHANHRTDRRDSTPPLQPLEQQRVEIYEKISQVGEGTYGHVI
jgi:hypothetical protein